MRVPKTGKWGFRVPIFFRLFFAVSEIMRIFALKIDKRMVKCPFSFRALAMIIDNRLLALVLLLLLPSATFSQMEKEVLVMKDPITGKWGFASKVQNRKSPLKGIKKFTVSTLGKAGTAIMTKSDAEAIDWVVPPLYDAIAPEFSEHLAGVEVGGLVGYIDINNRFIIEPQFEPMKNLEGFSMGLAAVKMGSKYGYIDKRGKTVIAPQFEYAENFHDNMLASIKKDGKYGAIDLNGNIVVPCKYIAEAAMVSVPISNKPFRQAADSVKNELQADHYKDILAQIRSSEELQNQVIADSSWVQPLTTTSVGDGEFKGIKDQYNRMIIPSKFSAINYDAENNLYVVNNAQGLYGLYTYKGDRLFHPLFDTMSSFINNSSTVTVEGIEGTIDCSGGMDPAFMDEICNRGLQYDKEGNAGKAYSLYERILTIDPNHVMALNNLAIMDIDSKDYNKGLKKLKLAHKLAPDNELVSENLHTAKKNRNERRWNRINTGLEIAAAVITLGAATYSIATGASTTTSGLSSGSSSFSSSTSSSSSDYSSSSKHDSSTSSKANHANWKALDRAYEGDETLLMKMKDSGNYNKDEVRRIQKRMKETREKIYKQSGGHQRAVSSMENWNP